MTQKWDVSAVAQTDVNFRLFNGKEKEISTLNLTVLLHGLCTFKEMFYLY